MNSLKEYYDQPQAGSSKENQLHYQKIGNRLKQLRIKSGYSDAEKFAYEHEINRSQYARYEFGTDMCISTLLKITDAHNITLHEFFKGVL
jgi:transcriptional regulator with XRE-family HTH domain